MSLYTRRASSPLTRHGGAFLVPAAFMGLSLPLVLFVFAVSATTTTNLASASPIVMPHDQLSSSSSSSNTLLETVSSKLRVFCAMNGIDCSYSTTASSDNGGGGGEESYANESSDTANDEETMAKRLADLFRMVKRRCEDARSASVNGNGCDGASWLDDLLVSSSSTANDTANDRGSSSSSSPSSNNAKQTWSPFLTVVTRWMNDNTFWLIVLQLLAILGLFVRRWLGSCRRRLERKRYERAALDDHGCDREEDDVAGDDNFDKGSSAAGGGDYDVAEKGGKRTYEMRELSSGQQDGKRGTMGGSRKRRDSLTTLPGDDNDDDYDRGRVVDTTTTATATTTMDSSLVSAQRSEPQQTWEGREETLPQQQSQRDADAKLETLLRDELEREIERTAAATATSNVGGGKSVRFIDTPATTTTTTTTGVHAVTRSRDGDENHPPSVIGATLKRSVGGGGYVSLVRPTEYSPPPSPSSSTATGRRVEANAENESRGRTRWPYSFLRKTTTTTTTTKPTSVSPTTHSSVVAETATAAAATTQNGSSSTLTTAATTTTSATTTSTTISSPPDSVLSRGKTRLKR